VAPEALSESTTITKRENQHLDGASLARVTSSSNQSAWCEASQLAPQTGPACRGSRSGALAHWTLGGLPPPCRDAALMELVATSKHSDT